MNTVTAPSVSENIDSRKDRSPLVPASRRERRNSLGIELGQPFNPFCLFDGALIPSEVLKNPDLLPSEKLVFARLMQFAGGKGKAWPSLERLAQEVALSVAQARRCIGALEAKGFIRRVARSGRSNEFEFLWHASYEQEPHSLMSAVPRSRVSAPRQSPVSGGRHSFMSGPGHSPVRARRESIESSSSEKIQVEENQTANAIQGSAKEVSIDDDCLHRRDELPDPEQEFLLRLEERHADSVDRHAILQCVISDLKSFSDLKPFLEFERRQTTAPNKLRNPAGHYRKAVQKFYETRAKRRDWDIREQMRLLEQKISNSPRSEQKQRQCALDKCNGTGECWTEDGLVRACECEIGRALPARVLAAFDQMNAARAARGVQPEIVSTRREIATDN